jgi:hypothetical protein
MPPLNLEFLIHNESDRGLPQSTMLSRFWRLQTLRQVVECASPLAL